MSAVALKMEQQMCILRFCQVVTLDSVRMTLMQSAYFSALCIEDTSVSSISEVLMTTMSV
jgi:hypothetical protein